MNKLTLTAFAVFCVITASGQIFGGGTGDGSDNDAYLQTSDNIFNGGGSDGWTNLSVFTGSNAYVCANGNSSLSAIAIASTYQWQVNTGSGFQNINNGLNYNDVNSISLKLMNIPSSFYGYQYRCIVDGVPGIIYTLKIAAYWTGTINTDWENTNNWGCGIVPDANTDVFIFGNKSNYPIVNTNTSCRSISSNSNTSIIISTGKRILLTGHN